MANELGTLVAKLAADVTDLKKGLQEGQQQLASFQGMAENLSARVKSALAFAGVTVGLGALVYKLKEFAASAVQVGSQVEVLRLSMYALGQNYGLSQKTLDHFIGSLREMGVSTEVAVASLNAFMKAGLSPEKIGPLVSAIKDLAPTVRMSFSEAMEAVLQSLQTGQPRLRALGLGFSEYLRAAGKAIKDETELGALSTMEKAQLIYDYLINWSQRLAGVSDATTQTYLRQQQSIARVIGEIKNLTYENFLAPIYTAVTGEKLAGWQELLKYLEQNKQKMRELGEAISVFVARLVNLVSTVASFIATHKDLAAWILTAYGLSKLLPLVASLSAGLSLLGVTAIKAVGGVAGLTVAAEAATVAFAGWLGVASKLLVVAGGIAAYGAYKGFQAARAEDKITPGGGPTSLGMAYGDVGHLGNMQPIVEQEKKLQEAKRGVRQQESQKTRDVSAAEAQKDVQQRQAEIQNFQQIAREQQEKLTKTLGGKKGATGEVVLDLAKYQLEELEAIFKGELAAAEANFEAFKGQTERKQVLLEGLYATGQMSAQEYYAALKAYEDAGYQEAVRIAELKMQAEAALFQKRKENLLGSGEDPRVISLKVNTLEIEHETKLNEIRRERNKIELDHEMILSRAAVEGAKAKKSVEDLLAQMQADVAFGALAENEAKVNQLLEEQKKKRLELLELLEKARKEGQLTAEEVAAKTAAFDTAAATQVWKAQSGEQFKSMAQGLRGGFESLIDSIFEKGQDLQASLTNLAKSLLKMSMKPFFDQVEQMLLNGFRALGQAIARGVSGMFNEASGGGGGFFSNIGGFFASFFSGGGSSFAGATAAPVAAFASGGVLVGETGPEVIFPLQRGSDGKMGISADFAGSAAHRGEVNVTVINNGEPAQAQARQTPDGDIEIQLDALMAKQAGRGGQFTSMIQKVYGLSVKPVGR